jgi:hypothetical protein
MQNRVSSVDVLLHCPSKVTESAGSAGSAGSVMMYRPASGRYFNKGEMKVLTLAGWHFDGGG